MHGDVLLSASPEEAGLRTDYIEAAYALIERWCSEQRIPKAVLAIGHKGLPRRSQSVWLCRLEPDREEMRPDTIFDLAFRDQGCSYRTLCWRYSSGDVVVKRRCTEIYSRGEGGGDHRTATYAYIRTACRLLVP